MSLPGISCYCSTYGRPTHILENSIQCFLEQDYAGPKELVILNDFADQRLVFDHPEVRIINLSERIKPLGRKFNANIDLCKYDIVATWEDDDVFLRNRLSVSLHHMRNGVFHTHNGYHEVSEHEIIQTGNYFHSTHMFTKDLFERVGRYSEESDSCAIDIEFMKRVGETLGPYSTALAEPDLFYVYVWAAGQSYHGSGWGVENTMISDMAKTIVDHHVQTGHVKAGTVHLEPKLRYNFYEFLPRS